MIVSWIMHALATTFVWVVSHLPQVTPPTWLAQLTDWVSQSVTMLTHMGYWMPVTQIATATAFVLGCAGVSLGVKLARIIMSFLTAGGGSAA